MASSTLNTALLASVGEKNRNHLKTTFPALKLKLYMLSPRDIVDTMRAKHGVATSDDVSKLRDPLSRALMSLSDLTDHIIIVYRSYRHKHQYSSFTLPYIRSKNDKSQ
jgi:hypothetical protein